MTLVQRLQIELLIFLYVLHHFYIISKCLKIKKKDYGAFKTRPRIPC